MSDAKNNTSELREPPDEPLYAGYTRFELELEFVQFLANPMYLNFLATEKHLEDPRFVAHLDYLQYFTKPEFAKYLKYPATTLRNLELLQQEQFRKDIIMPETVQRLIDASINARPADPL